MKTLVRKTVLLACACVMLSPVTAQTNIGGVINTYVDVTIVGPCANRVTVSNPAGFTAGNSVIIIQMQGATMYELNDGNFGNIISPNNSGYWEKAIIHSVSGNMITLTKNLLNTYDVSGKVQMILLPTYANANVSSTLTGSSWNGSTGGVVALEVTGTLSLNANIDASGIGFRGGSNTQVCPNSCNFITNENAQYYPAGNYRGAYKGEGITAVITNKELGMGPQTNGGGGGNDHNNGGGGAGNYTTGGLGGNNNEPGGFNCKGGGNYGRPGKALDYTSLQRLFLGGGGGAGHGNNGSFPNCTSGGFSGTGGNGGGIIIIIAGSISGNGFSILSNGATGGGSFNDGAGGGGAGGTILLVVPGYTGNVFIEAKGGNGGDSNNSVSNRCVGPGGGGGAGVILSSISLPVSVSSTLIAGTAGYVTNSVNACNLTHTTATDGGGPGTVLTGATIRQSTANPASGCGLPVTFIHFTGKAIQEKIELKWATATELDADYFAIERSSNQVDFLEIGRVTAAGNTSTRTDYSFMDELPYPGTNYYRIRQADVTGYEKYTSVIAVEADIKRLVKNIYPNPLSPGGEMFISFTDPEKDHVVRITDVSGRLLVQWNHRRQGSSLETFRLPDLRSGIYLATIRTPERSETYKLVVE